MDATTPKYSKAASFGLVDCWERFHSRPDPLNLVHSNALTVTDGAPMFGYTPAALLCFSWTEQTDCSPLGIGIGISPSIVRSI
jgi:hypothetical protein